MRDFLQDQFSNADVERFIVAVLDDDTGISEDAFELLGKIVQPSFVSDYMGSTDGRFYINPE